MKKLLICLCALALLAGCTAPPPKLVDTSTPVPTSPPPTLEEIAQQTPTPSPVYPEPVFPDTEASGVTQSNTNRDYSPRLVQDNDPATAWSFTGDGDEWIMLSADSEQMVSGIRILNGYAKYSPEYNMWLYYANNRPKSITLTFSDGTYIEKTLEDTFDGGSYQDINFGEPKLTMFIKLAVNSVYKGERWNDTCISEIQPYGGGGADAAPPSPALAGGKLWDDGVYLTMPVLTKGIENAGWEDESLQDVATQWVVYDNYGKVVAQYNNADYPTVFTSEKADVVYCNTSNGLNIFRYDTLAYAADNGKLKKYSFKIDGNTLKISSGGKTYTYDLPDREEYEYEADDIQVNGDMLAVRVRWDNYKLILYKTGKDISNLLDEFKDDDHFDQVDLKANGAIISKCAKIDTETAYDDIVYSEIIDKKGEVLYETPYHENGNILLNHNDWVGYLGHGLFSLWRGNYYGVVNAKGEWLIRALYLDAD